MAGWKGEAGRGAAPCEIWQVAGRGRVVGDSMQGGWRRAAQ